MVTLLCFVAFLFVIRSPAVPTPEVVVQQVAPSPAETPTAIISTETPTLPTAAANASPTPTPFPSATSTRVVVETVLPTPTPTRANCANDIKDFGASGLITDEQIILYLQETIPVSHLDHCRAIQFTPVQAAVHGTPIAGNFIPVYREINVYGFQGQYQTGEQLLDTLIHEVGHNVHYNLRRDNFDLDVQWSTIYRESLKNYKANGSGFVSGYAASNKFEDFAESYMVYIRYPDLLLQYSPAKYEFLRREVFQGQEYNR